MASKTPIPIITVGAREAVGQHVIEAMKPEFDVIHFTLLDSAAAEIPGLLSGETIPSPSSRLGSGNPGPARAVVFGGAATDELVAELAAAVDARKGRGVPWLRVDNSKPAPPLGPEYAKAVTQRAKEALVRLEEEGRLEAEEGKGRGEVVFF